MGINCILEASEIVKLVCKIINFWKYYNSYHVSVQNKIWDKQTPEIRIQTLQEIMNHYLYLFACMKVGKCR